MRSNLTFHQTIFRFLGLPLPSDLPFIIAILGTTAGNQQIQEPPTKDTMPTSALQVSTALKELRSLANAQLEPTVTMCYLRTSHSV